MLINNRKLTLQVHRFDNCPHWKSFSSEKDRVTPKIPNPVVPKCAKVSKIRDVVRKERKKYIYIYIYTRKRIIWWAARICRVYLKCKCRWWRRRRWFFPIADVAHVEHAASSFSDSSFSRSDSPLSTDGRGRRGRRERCCVLLVASLEASY